MPGVAPEEDVPPQNQLPPLNPTSDADAESVPVVVNTATEPAPPTEAQMEAQVSTEKKNSITTILKLAAFIDLAGVVLLAPAYPSLVLNAPSAPQPVNSTVPPSAFPASEFGTTIHYSLAVMLFGMCTAAGAAIGNPVAGVLSDKIGRKPVILICLLGGSASYLLMFLAGFLFRSFYVFLAGNFINGLFGGSRGAISAFLMDLWGKEFPRIQPGLVSLFIFGAAGGGILGLIILLATPEDTPGHLFIPAAVASVLSTICALLVYFKCPEPARKAPPPAMVTYHFTKQQKDVVVDDDGGVAISEAGPFVKPEWTQQAPAKGTYAIANEVKGTKGEQIELEGGTSFENPEKKGVGSGVSGEVEVPKKLQTILWTIILAGSLDNFGDSGTNFMRQALFTKRYTPSVGVTAQAVFLILMIICIKIAIELVVRTSLMKPLVQLKYWTLIGNVSTGIFQLLLIPLLLVPQTFPVFWFLTTLLWAMCKCFGFTSTAAAIFLLPMYAPPDQRGMWMGRNAGAQALTAVFTPLILSLIEGSLPPGTSESVLGPGGIAVLVTCGVVSLLAAVVFFFGLVVIIPRPIKTKPFTCDDLEKYVTMAPRDFGLLPFDERNAVNKKLSGSDKDTIHVPWGKYIDDVPNLGFMINRGEDELDSLKNHILGMLTNKAVLAKELASIGKYGQKIAAMDKDQERADFGNWIADYLDDAGYTSWMMYPDIYKLMIMNAFPPMEELDNLVGHRQESFTMAAFEKRMLDWLEMLDIHIQSHRKAKQSLDSVPAFR